MSMKRFDGSAYADVSVRKRFDGGAWVPLTFGRRWDGAAWVNREDPRDIESYIMTGDLEMDVLEQLRVQKVMVRVMVGPYAECSLLVAYDNDKDKLDEIQWEEIAHWTGDTPGEDDDNEQESEELSDDTPGEDNDNEQESEELSDDTPGEDYDYDQEPEELWRELTTRNAETAYIVPRRCDHFRLAIACTGLVKIMRLNYIYKPGTEIRVR